MKSINNKSFSLPPYISTSWSSVESLYMKGATLVVLLVGGETVTIPGLKQEIIDLIFAAHASYLEHEASQPSKERQSDTPFGIPFFSHSFPILSGSDSALQFGISSLDGFTPAMDHNPSLANAPDIPAEIVQRIASMIKLVVPEEMIAEPQPIENCNCPHCQVARAIANELKSAANSKNESLLDEEIVTEADLVFKEWEINLLEENLYSVKRKLDPSALEFKVFLGDPVGCTCGQPGCEHIIAVLKS